MCNLCLGLVLSFFVFHLAEEEREPLCDLIVCVFVRTCVFVPITLHVIAWPIIMAADATCVCVRRGGGGGFNILYWPNFC